MADKKEIKQRYEVQEVPTEMGKVVIDNETGKTLSDEILLHILNKIDTIEKAVC